MSNPVPPGYEFADVAERRRNTLAAMARTRQQMRPVTWLLRRVFDLSQVLRFEFPLFQRVFKPMAAGLFDKAIAKAFSR